MESTRIDVTKSNFLEQSNDFIKNVPNASFVALDEEMTGIMLPAGMGKPLTKDETPAERYPNLKLVPERYAIMQLGICLFEQRSAYEADAVEHAAFHVRRYKFTLFPPAESTISREIVLNPSSMHFLAQNNMNLDQWTREGIPFCTGDVATNLFDEFFKDQLNVASKKTSSNSSCSRGGRVELARVEDKDFHARAMASLREWLDSAIAPGDGGSEGTSFLLPPCNAFLRRALYESIPLEYPSLVLETFEGTQIRVWRMNSLERRRRNQRLRREGWEKLLKEKVGAWRIFLALSKACLGQSPTTQAEHMALASNVEDAMKPFQEGADNSTSQQRNIPLIVHNGLHDLLFLFTHFHGPKLPDDWDKCKTLVHAHFPVVYDTKIMASESCLRGASRSHTHLAAVYQQVITCYPRFSSDGQHDQEHDAAFDAYMTGVAFCGLAHSISEQEGLSADSQRPLCLVDGGADQCEVAAKCCGRNRLYFHLSPYTIDLESPGPDPMRWGMSRKATFRVSGIDPTISTRDIVRYLRGMLDSDGRSVNFEIIWVDDTTFLVGVMIEDASEHGNFEEHGEILFNALRGRFQRETIKSLMPEVGRNKEYRFWNLWGLFGDLSSDEGSGVRKRRRIE